MSGRRRPTGAELSFTLPRRLTAQLVHYCAQHGETPAAVIADAVALHLDEVEVATNEIPAPAGIGAEKALQTLSTGAKGREEGCHHSRARPPRVPIERAEADLAVDRDVAAHVLGATS